MVALCGEHHPKADAGAFTAEQLRDYKRRAAAAAPEIKGRFDLLRRDIAIFSGGMLYIENDFDVVVNGRPVLWFDRDDEGYALLNVRMPQASSSKRVAIEDNSWVSVGNPVDVRNLIYGPMGSAGDQRSPALWCSGRTTSALRWTSDQRALGPDGADPRSSC